VLIRAIPAIERLLVAVGTGVASLLLLVNIIGVLASMPMSEVNAAHLNVLGRWLLPIYAGAIAFLVAGIPVGIICGFLCGMRAPHYSVAAAAVITLPFMVSHLSDPSVYFAGLVVSLGHYLGCIAGASARLKLYPAPLFRWPRAKSSPPRSVLSTDAVLLAAFVFLATSVHALASGSGSTSNVVVAALFTAGMLIARYRLRVATGASAA
jgi:hypothetical protein